MKSDFDIFKLILILFIAGSLGGLVESCLFEYWRRTEDLSFWEAWGGPETWWEFVQTPLGFCGLICSFGPYLAIFAVLGWSK